MAIWRSVVIAMFVPTMPYPATKYTPMNSTVLERGGAGHQRDAENGQRRQGVAGQQHAARSRATARARPTVAAAATPPIPKKARTSPIAPADMCISRLA